MSEREFAEESVQNNKICWVHTKWGRHQAKTLIEVMEGNKHYVVVQMISNAFKIDKEIQKFERNKVEYI